MISPEAYSLGNPCSWMGCLKGHCSPLLYLIHNPRISIDNTAQNVDILGTVYSARGQRWSASLLGTLHHLGLDHMVFGGCVP